MQIYLILFQLLFLYNISNNYTIQYIMTDNTLLKKKSRTIDISFKNLEPNPEFSFKKNISSNLKLFNNETDLKYISSLKNKNNNQYFYSNFNIYKKKNRDQPLLKSKDQLKHRFMTEKFSNSYHEPIKIQSIFKLPDINSAKTNKIQTIKKGFVSNINTSVVKRKYFPKKAQRKNLKNLKIECRNNDKLYTQIPHVDPNNHQQISKSSIFLTNLEQKSKVIKKKINTLDLYEGWERQKSQYQWQFSILDISTHNIINRISNR